MKINDENQNKNQFLENENKDDISESIDYFKNLFEEVADIFFGDENDNKKYKHC
ncbi:MAG: hypothetical protein ACI4SR_03835 [Faecalibacillus sp.]